MNKKPAFVFTILVVCLLAPGVVNAQRKIQGQGFDSGSAGLRPIAPKPEVRQKIIKKMTFVAVSPTRGWTSSKGKKINGTLIAFDAESDKPGEKRPLSELVIIKDGKVRLVKGNKPFVLDLKQLSALDQQYVHDLEKKRKAAAGGAENKKDDNTSGEKPAPASASK